MPYSLATKSKERRIPRGNLRSFRRSGGTRGDTMRNVFRWRAKGFFRWSPDCWACS
jgi:hypothetical protein